MLEEDVEGFGCGEGALEAGGAEGVAGFGDEGCESGGGEVVVEDGFVADDDEFDERPFVVFIVIVAAAAAITIGPGDEV